MDRRGAVNSHGSTRSAGGKCPYAILHLDVCIPQLRYRDVTCPGSGTAANCNWQSAEKGGREGDLAVTASVHCKSCEPYYSEPRNPARL